MSQELVKHQAPRALSVSKEAIDAVQEAFAVNVAGGSLSEYDLPRIKIMSGAPLWLVPSLEGEETAPRIEGVVVFSRDARIYYQSTEIGNVPPDCFSSDGITGKGKPGGRCAECPLARWDSTDSGAQACKQVKQLFMIRGDSMFPEVVSLPPTSVKSARQFLVKLTTQGIPYFKALVAIELEKAENAQKKPYGRAVFKFLRRLTAEENERALEFHKLCQDFAVEVPADSANPPASETKDEEVPY